jgi:hypothetical protein
VMLAPQGRMLHHHASPLNALSSGRALPAPCAAVLPQHAAWRSQLSRMASTGAQFGAPLPASTTQLSQLTQHPASCCSTAPSALLQGVAGRRRQRGGTTRAANHPDIHLRQPQGDGNNSHHEGDSSSGASASSQPEMPGSTPHTSANGAAPSSSSSNGASSNPLDVLRQAGASLSPPPPQPVPVFGAGGAGALKLPAGYLSSITSSPVPEPEAKGLPHRWRVTIMMAVSGNALLQVVQWR